MSNPRVARNWRSAVGPQAAARLVALRFVLDCHAKKGAVPQQSRPDDAERILSDSASNHSTT
jgi:hypothetical protein